MTSKYIEKKPEAFAKMTPWKYAETIINVIIMACWRNENETSTKYFKILSGILIKQKKYTKNIKGKYNGREA